MDCSAPRWGAATKRAPISSGRGRSSSRSARPSRSPKCARSCSRFPPSRPARRPVVSPHLRRSGVRPMARDRFAVCCALVVVACAHRVVPPLAGGSSAPVMELPQRVALITAPRGPDEWKALGNEAAQLLSQYLRINTTNPPGNERRAADWLAAVLAREGIEAQVFEPAPGKANLYARLRGDGTARPIILLNHMD